MRGGQAELNGGGVPVTGLVVELGARSGDQIRIGFERGQPRGGAIAVAYRDRVIETHGGRWVQLRERRRDLGFHPISGDDVARRGCFQMSEAFGDEPAIPPRTILVWKSNGFAGVRVEARGEPGGLKQEQSEQGRGRQAGAWWW